MAEVEKVHIIENWATERHQVVVIGRRARKFRNVAQEKLDYVDNLEGAVRERMPEVHTQREADSQRRSLERSRATQLDLQGLPHWAAGVHVEKAGRFQWAVVVTSWRDRT